MTNLDKVRIYEAAIRKFGLAGQKLKTIEELAELQRALARDLTLDAPEEAENNVREEIADVMIMLDQMVYLYDRAEIEDWKDSKLERLARMVGVEVKDNPSDPLGHLPLHRGGTGEAVTRCMDCAHCYDLEPMDPLKPYSGKGSEPFFCEAFDIDFYPPNYRADTFFCKDGAPRGKA